MAMSFRLLNCPSHAFDHVSKHKKNRTRKNSILAIPPSSIFLQTNESGNKPDSKRSSSLDAGSIHSNSGSSLLSQTNSVGIIAGVSIDTTLNFVKKLVKWSSRDMEGGLPFVLCSTPTLNKESLSHESSLFSFNSKSERLQGGHSTIIENLKCRRAFLEHSGTRCIVLPCHISHSWHDEISKGCSVPFLHMAQCVARELKEANLRSLESGHPSRIGVLATNPNFAAEVYQEELQNEGFEVVLPDKATMEHTIVPAVEALGRKDMEGARNLLRIALQVLLMRAVNTVVLTSDDMWDLLPQDDPLLRKCIDPMDALARSTVRCSQSAEIVPKNDQNL